MSVVVAILGGLDGETFWALMGGLGRCPGGRHGRLEWLRGELRCRLAAEGVEFQAHLEATCEVVATGALWRAVSRIESGLCSDDGFDYFALWLVAQGQGTYKAVLADPDALADVAEVRALTGRSPREWRDEEWPEWEELDYVALEVFDELTGQGEDCGEAFYEVLEAIQETWAEPGGEPADTEAEVRIGTPRLDALFPVEAGP
ncbi:DUF4240 domain-containing protein [Streptomyces sp. NPDC087218]|uniref:DUF4240 domain-containing protein n=1 Tax=Streptomyces sp. NPDC087218 TaxID=3365769 RepID=UPI00382FC002